MHSKEISKFKNLEAQIIVIGGGGTGLAAAVAAQKRAKVILLESDGCGNTALAEVFCCRESRAKG
jgi:glycine/D-amino acid oxidase-like deaminating enzyme